MKQLQQLAKKLKNLDTLFIDEAIKVSSRKSKQFSKANVDQLKSGIKSDGSNMPDYVQNSQSPSAPGKIKLLDTGAFHDGIEPLFDDVGIEMVGTDDKTNILANKYGSKILGLTDENRDKLKKSMMKDILNRVRKRL